MTEKELVLAIHNNNKNLKIINTQIDNLKDKKSEIESENEALKEKLLALMIDREIAELKYDDTIANIFHKESVGYKDDQQVINYLKDNGYTSLITTKITESLDKSAIKKELKVNPQLQSALESMLLYNTTKYVVVTSIENHEKMLEHIENGKQS